MQDNEAGGIFGPAQRGPPSDVSLGVSEFPDGQRAGSALQYHRDTEHDIVDGIAERLRFANMIPTLDRNPRTKGEDQDRDHERPE